MKIVQPGDREYNSDRRIANARFDYRPRYICYCASEKDVQDALKLAIREGLPVRVRSGGHQHEGMCSGNGVVTIDLSAFNQITFIGGSPENVWVGVGAKLGDVYEKTLGHNVIFPGGGCSDVRAGGLVQGGGWGFYSRDLGLTCDSLVGFKIILANGDVIQVNESDHNYDDLLWAVRGGGGGNFGIITEFHVSLTKVPDPIWQFSITWEDPGLRQPVMEDWRHNFPNEQEVNLTSFCRLSCAEHEDVPVVVGGNFIGDKARIEPLLQGLLPGTFRRGKLLPFKPVHNVAGAELRMAFHHPEYQPGPPLAALRALVPGEAPKETCNGGYYPHKVSSCFPRPDFSSSATQSINMFLDQSPPEPNARRYLSLHSMGGKIRNQALQDVSSFAWRDKPFILQYQAWWADPADKPLEQRCLAWIRDFRETMQRYTEGAFINFPDKDLVPNPDTPEGRVKLLEIYYAKKLDRLRRIKNAYDPNNILDFEMGLLPAP